MKDEGSCGESFVAERGTTESDLIVWIVYEFHGNKSDFSQRLPKNFSCWFKCLSTLLLWHLLGPLIHLEIRVYKTKQKTKDVLGIYADEQNLN